MGLGPYFEGRRILETHESAQRAQARSTCKGTAADILCIRLPVGQCLPVGEMFAGGRACLPVGAMFAGGVKFAGGAK